jgi:hypothetical protein
VKRQNGKAARVSKMTHAVRVDARPDDPDFADFDIE